MAKESSSDEATEFVSIAIAEKLSDIFIIPVKDIKLASRHAQLGIESLIALQLRNILVQQASAEVPIFVSCKAHYQPLSLLILRRRSHMLGRISFASWYNLDNEVAKDKIGLLAMLRRGGCC